MGDAVVVVVVGDVGVDVDCPHAVNPTTAMATTGSARRREVVLADTIGPPLAKSERGRGGADSR